MPLKRPSPAQKNVPQITFSAFASCARLRHVQSLLSKSSDKTSSSVDAILCILGIDSRYNEGCRELANYLLFGFLDLRKEELDRSGIDEDIGDDVILLVKEDSVHVHYMPSDHTYVIPYIAHWRNLHLHSLTDEEAVWRAVPPYGSMHFSSSMPPGFMIIGLTRQGALKEAFLPIVKPRDDEKEQHKENEDAAEDFKVLSFIEMVRGCSTIGVPYFARDHVQTFDHFAVEKWPLVQAYGLEDFGTGGFFTMKHEVVDVSESLSQIYDIMDPVSLERLVTQQLPLFERQWNALLTNIDIAFKERSTLGELTESTVVEPLKSFYTHGHVATPGLMKSCRKPLVLFGQRSSNITPPETDGSIGTAGVGNNTAKHMICQAVGPKSPLCCGRTYFFGSGHAPYPVTGGTPRAPRPPKTDIELLSKLYKVAIDAVMASIKAYGQTSSTNEAEALCKQSLREGCAEDMLNADTYIARMQFSLEAFDHNGNKVPLQENKPSPLVKMACLRLDDIGSLEHGGNSLGSLLFSESFLDSRILVSHPGQIPTVDSKCLILTSHVPRYVSWTVDVAETISSKLTETFTKSSDVFGKTLLSGESIVALGSKEQSTAHEGKLYICEKGIVFQDSRHGVVIFPKSYFEEMLFFDGDSSSVIAALVITYRHSLQQYLPIHYHNEGDTVMFAFTPKTRAHRAFYSEVISLWLKKSDEPILKLVDKVPEYFVAPHAEIQMQYAVANRLNVDSRPISVAMANLYQLKSFLEHFSASSVGDAPIPDRDLASVLNRKPADQVNSGTDTGKIVVTIVTGIPGSHKENLCNILTNMAKEQSRWVTLRQPFDSTDAFSPESLQASLGAILVASKKRNVRAATGGRKKMRVLITTPGFTDTVDIVRAIICHPDPKVSQQVRIGAVTACVDAHNTFMAHRYTFPKLLDQCAQGWVNNVLFTSSTSGPDPLLSIVQDLLRRVNPWLAFILANKGEISRSEDVDRILSESLFTMPSMIRARHLLTPGWTESEFCTGTIYPAMSTVSLKFSQPLDRAKLLVKLRNLRDQDAKGCPFTGNIYRVTGRTKFTDSDQLMELQSVTLSSYISLTPASETAPIRPPTAPQTPSPPCQPSPPGTHAYGPNEQGDNGQPYCVVFVGCGLEERKLKGWLRSCARQRPEEKPLKTKQSLTREERKGIHTKRHLDVLPEGWFYNGSQYVSMTGEKTDTHPDMDAFINEYLKQANTFVEKYNTRIESEVYKDLFA